MPGGARGRGIAEEWAGVRGRSGDRREKGRRLENAGVAPDVKVVRTAADVRAGRDVDLEAALRVLAKEASSRSGAARP